MSGLVNKLQRKKTLVENNSTFHATCNATFCCIPGCENRVLDGHFFFVTRNGTFLALQVAGEIALCNMHAFI